MRNLLILVLLVTVGCELPTLWETTTTSTATCQRIHIWEDLDGNGGLWTTVTTSGETVQMMADSVRYEECDHPAYDGLVLRWNGEKWAP